MYDFVQKVSFHYNSFHSFDNILEAKVKWNRNFLMIFFHMNINLMKLDSNSKGTRFLQNWLECINRLLKELFTM